MSEATDTGSLPMTEPHMAPIFDTGPHPVPLPSEEVGEPLADDVPPARVPDAQSRR